MAQQVTPYLLYEDGEAAIEFLANAFGFREVDRTIGGAGGLHAELDLDGRRVYVGQPPAGFQNPAKVGRTSLVFVLLEGVDAHCERARAEGAEIVEEPTDVTAAGHHRYGCRDPQGHEWFFAEPLDATA
jgi:uncharacterized glyoxalase superfamily protein PhnB